jgi:hypothetical protein
MAGWFSLLLSLTAGVLFVGAGMGITADRSQRIPVVTWQRTAALLAGVACLASWTAFGMALYALGPTNSRLVPGWFAIFLFIIDNLMFIFYIGMLYEN